jgi:formiminoglutamase
MLWETRYLPPNPITWQGRLETALGPYFYQRVSLLNLLTEKPKKQSQNAFAIVGFQCDEGIQRDLGRAGAFEGPTAIRQYLAKLPIQKPDLTIYDAGNITCTDHDLEASQQGLADIISILLEHNIRPLVLGGGHEVAWGQYQGIAHVNLPPKRIGIINFDAHFGLHPLYPSHRGSATTPFYQIGLAHQATKRHFDYNCIGIQHASNTQQAFTVANQFDTNIIFADELYQGQQEKCIDFIDRVIDQNELLYMSLSLDVFSPAHAPGVSSIQPLGLNPWHVIPLIRQIAASAKVVSYDIVEHVPRYDIDHRTAQLAATLIYEIMHHHNEHPRSW